MKLYSEFRAGSMSLTHNGRLRGLLRQVISTENVQYVLETGTFQGLGSTTFIAECFPQPSPPRRFVTIEANWDSWRRARWNLRRFPFVTCVWGLSIELEQGLAFVNDDDWIRNHADHPDIYIDGTDDPVGFYSNELKGKLRGEMATSIWARIRQPFDRIFHYQGEGLLKRCLQEMKESRPLVVLDSAGGTGLLEFTILREFMSDRPYLLLLDDVHHIKHYRSLCHVQTDPSFELLGHSQVHGWALAKHTPR
jgi:hypothetical protein